MLFRPKRRGRAFTILQHPVVRVESLYHSRGSGLEWMSMSEYLDSIEFIDNWVVRSLTNHKRGELAEDDLLVAKGILASKFVIGIADHFEESIKRLEIYYEWGPQRKEGCVENYLKNFDASDEDNVQMQIERGGSEWKLIAGRERFDLMLYYYALEIFTKQATTMFNRPYVDKTGKPIDFLEVKRKNDLREEMLQLFGGM